MDGRRGGGVGGPEGGGVAITRRTLPATASGRMSRGAGGGAGVSGVSGAAC